MSANIKHILQDAAVPPPPGAWDAIHARLDTEYDAREGRIADKLYEWEATPPPGAWQHIALALDVTEAARETTTSTTPAAPAKIVRLPFRRIAVAAILLVVAGIATWSFLNYNQQAATAVVAPQPVITTPGQQEITARPSLPEIDASIGSPAKNRIDVARRVNSHTRIYPEYSTAVVQEDPFNDIQYAAMNDLRAQAITQRKGVKAPLIKDASGNVILDKTLIISHDKNYIIITGPNGEQTRLSSKFLPVLTDLNATSDPAEYLDLVIRESNIWKGRFSQWRSRLLQEASFAPTAANFLDIMALKDLIEEK